MAKFPEFKREFKYTSELSENEVYMLLGLPIGNDGNAQKYIIGAVFAEEMYFWRSAGYEICVKINCPGGVIMDGFSIIDAIRQTGAKTQCVGIAASMAMPILLSGSNRSAYDYAKGMIHPPKGRDKAAVDMMRDSLSTILTKLSDFSKNEIDGMLKDGAPDTWLSAKDMKKHGLIDHVIETGMELKGEESDPYALYNVYNTLIKKEEMSKESKTEDALQIIEDVKARMDAQDAAISAKDAEIAALKAKLQEKEQSEELARNTAANTLVENAIKEGKISIPNGDQSIKDQFVKMAKETPEAFNAILESKKPATRKSVTSHIKVSGGDNEEDTYEYLANYQPGKLQEIMDNEPEKFKKLEAAYHEKVRNRKIA